MTVFALLLRDNFETDREQLQALAPYIGVTSLVAALALVALRLNRGVWRLSTMSDYLRIVGACAIAVSAAMAVGFIMNRLENVARSLPIIQLLLMIFALIGSRVAARLLFSWHARWRNADDAKAIADFGRAVENVLVVGVTRLANLYIRSAEEFGGGNVRIAAILTTQKGHHGRMVGQHKVVGSPAMATEVIKDLAVHGVFVTRIVVMMRADQLTREERAHLFDAATRSQIPVEFVAETLGFAGDTKAVQTHRPAGLPSASDMAALNEQLSGYAERPYWRFKRAAEFVVSALLIAALAPLFVLIAVLVAFDVGSPVIFWQQRPGARGIPFRVYKFRTMAASHDAAGRRIKDDDRISSIGTFLRRSRLDELPQLFNVLWGEMSFIGPRPLLPKDQFPGLEARLAIAPGITGWAQINGGREVSAVEKAALDIWYLTHASLRVDVRIAWSTLVMMLRGEERRDEVAIESALREIAIALPQPALVASPVHETASVVRMQRPVRVRTEKGSQALA